MSDIKPYTISVPQKKLDTLKQKLSLAEFPDELPNAGWEMGVPLSDLKRLTQAWQSYDWRAAEAKLNQVPQYHTSIQAEGFSALDIHFVHQPSKVKNAIPLLFVHGWPGSFYEVLKLLEPLTNPDDPSKPAFHVVAPSLPNFGFSEGAKERGFGLAQYAEVCNKLMLKLGYNEYVSQAGDWGWWITRALGKLYPENIKASHFNLILAKAPAEEKDWPTEKYDKWDQEGFARTKWFDKEGFGYNLLQGTRPQTIAYALHDSPTALLAWILEKLHDWTDSYPWTDEDILIWISIYQFSTAGPGAAGRIYYEAGHTDPDETRPQKGITYDKLKEYTPKVKIGIAYNPKELAPLPKSWGRTLGEVVYEVKNKSGGHFYAHERPEWTIRDLREMFGKGGAVFGIVEGKAGYD